MSKKNKSEKYKGWTRVWGSGREKEVTPYPDWAKDYHAIDSKGGLVINPELSFGTVEKTVQQPDEELTEKLWGEGGSWDSLSELAAEAPSGRDILEAGIDIIKMLLEKNIAYSNSAMDPLNILSTATPEEQIKMHIDNKLTRLKYQKEFQNEDSLKDLAGYVILLMVLKKSQ